jgi:hypothetical protein
MLTKLKYGLIEELIHMYKQFIRGCLEYCSVAWSSFLTAQQSYSLERCQAVALKTSLLRRLQAQTLPNEAPPIGKIHPFSKMAVTFEPMIIHQTSPIPKEWAHMQRQSAF